MKVVVSYISSKYNPKKTIDLINDTIADGIHVDLMDGTYVGMKNFEEDNLINLFADNMKELDVHMMINNPSRYLDTIYKLNPSCIYIHPKTEEGLIGILKNINERGIKRGIVINPDENIDEYAHYFPYIDRILLMSVYPGKGGQRFLDSTKKRLEELVTYQKDNKFEIFVDGGINDETINLVKLANGVVSGSFICQSNNFNEQIKKLMN